MANVVDNKNIGFSSGSFRGEEVTVKSGDITETISMLKTKDSSKLEESFNLDIEKLFDRVGGKLAFDTILNGGDKKKLYDQIYSMISDDMSVMGGSLSAKSEIREFFMKECVDLGDGLNSQFEVSVKLKGYSLLAMLMALACNGVSNGISTILETMSDEVDPSLVKSVIPRLLDIHNGNDAIGLIEDIATSSIGGELGSYLTDGVDQFIDFYNKDTSSNRSGKYKRFDTAMTGLFGNWSGEEPVKDISSINSGQLGTDISDSMWNKVPSFNPSSTVVEEYLDEFDSCSLF